MLAAQSVLQYVVALGEGKKIDWLWWLECGNCQTSLLVGFYFHREDENLLAMEGGKLDSIQKKKRKWENRW